MPFSSQWKRCVHSRNAKSSSKGLADQFLPAIYETRVAAALIQAGFEVTFEDEGDSTATHCEFTASFPKTGKKFSVEAKLRRPNKDPVDVGNQLYEALRKEADYPRI